MHTNRPAAAARPAQLARLLWPTSFVLALVACGGGGSADPAPGANPAAGGTATLPAELAAQWETVLAYVPVSYTGPIGGTAPGDGSLGITLVLTADGRYRHVWNMSQAYFDGNCFRTGGWDEYGTVAADGQQYTFTPTKATYIQTDTCGQNKFLDPAPVSPGSHTLKVELDAAGWPHLRVGSPTGDIVLEKCRHCG